MALTMKTRDDPKSKLNIADHLKRLLTRTYAVDTRKCVHVSVCVHMRVQACYFKSLALKLKLLTVPAFLLVVCTFCCYQ